MFYPYLDDISASLKDKFSYHNNIFNVFDSSIPEKIARFNDLLPTLAFYEDDLVHNNSDILEAVWKLGALQ